MSRRVLPGPRTGALSVPASKSQAHRLLICAALGRAPVTVHCGSLSADITATVRCLRALGAAITEPAAGTLEVRPITAVPAGEVLLPCGESGSTLRFLLPVCGALGVRAVFRREGQLPKRPLDVTLTAHGMIFKEKGKNLYIDGKLHPGDYTVPGDISSQYISGLLMALPLLPEASALTITGPARSAGYITMTERALRQSGIFFEKQERTYRIPGCQAYALPSPCRVEGDWSGAAPFLCMGALSPDGITVTGLDPDSLQGDRALLDILRAMGARVTVTDRAVTVSGGPLYGLEIDAGPIPDLVPALAVLACGAAGRTVFTNAGRLRLKESDRLGGTAALINRLGGQALAAEDELTVIGSPLTGGTIDPAGDHRMAMAAALAASLCREPVTVSDPQCVNKSYPGFWHDLEQLKGAAL